MRPPSQVHEYNALLLHLPQAISVDMSSFRGHFGTLMPFFRACEKAGGFVGESQPIVGAPADLPGAQEALPPPSGGACDTGHGRGGRSHGEGEAAMAGGDAALGVTLEDLMLYDPPKRSSGEVVDWAAPIRSAWRRFEVMLGCRFGSWNANRLCRAMVQCMPSA